MSSKCTSDSEVKFDSLMDMNPEELEQACSDTWRMSTPVIVKGKNEEEQDDSTCNQLGKIFQAVESLSETVNTQNSQLENRLNDLTKRLLTVESKQTSSTTTSNGNCNDKSMVDHDNNELFDALAKIEELAKAKDEETVNKGTVAASCEDVIEVNSQFREMKEEPVRCVNREPTKCSTAVPKHLEDMFQKSGNELSNAQREKLSALLIDYADIFACSSGDLGRTNLVEHRINTGDTIPIKQPARRLPMHRLAEAEEHVKKMLNDVIIEPSSSAWASPIVLVLKEERRVYTVLRRLPDAERSYSQGLVPITIGRLVL
ncbi:hypothetical protein QZH41_001863 [Actinostola sp. cb2023]|nr:hypothetical protein QZH41_001863 [Actinostola sp. cb2023]